MGVFDDCYAADEDLSNQVGGDWLAGAPKLVDIVSGTDGFFAGSDRWTLNSPSEDFAGHGLETGHVVKIWRPKSGSLTEIPPKLFGVVEDSATAGSPNNTVTLRRLGKPEGVGQPPGVSGTPTTGVYFAVYTAEAALRKHSNYIRQLYGLEGRDLEADGTSEAVKIVVLDLCEIEIFFHKEREYVAGTGRGGDFGEKSKDLRKQVKDLMDWLAVQYPAGSEPDGFTVILV
jgi:hypothetical protein